MSFFSGSATPHREPSAGVRQSAATLHEMYTAYVEAGFSKQQALQIVISVLQVSVAASRGQLGFGDGS